MSPKRTHATGEDWVGRSNENARLLLENMARFSPEAAAFWGVEGVDEQVFRLPPDVNRQRIEANQAAIDELTRRLGGEEDPAVRQDLEILIEAARENIEEIQLNDKYLVPYFNVPETIFRGVRTLLDEQVQPERRSAARVRLERYAGAVDEYEPIVDQVIAFTRARFDKGLRGPFKADVEKDLATAPRFIEGIRALFEQYAIEGYEPAYDALREQLDRYDKFVREEILPRASDDYRLPPELYRFNLKAFGIDMPQEELVGRAKAAFREIQNEMQTMATLIAEQRRLPSADYREVLRVLKREQIVGEAILPHYQERIRALEGLIEEHRVVTLPEREMRIRLASEAESAATPAPHMRPPRLINNSGEMGEFVLPLRIPGEAGDEDTSFDDFSFDAASWTLTVHEGRPGHELQFAAMVEKGVSQARALFAFNSVNVEGWALYSEAEMKPYLPLEGQLVSLQARLLRAARAFLDPGLQSGDITRDEAYRTLEEDVVMSAAMSMQEVERYTFRMPGQATSYFCGYVRLMELRTDVERILGDRFDRLAFHDFVLAQGLLPPVLLRQTVMDHLVAPRKRG